MSVPPKYRAIGDFHEYYSGKRVAPYLTIFIGGNHEASSHLFELYYGGWVAPNIYYMGAANVLRLGGLRIAGLSGIWKGFDFKRPHGARPPYSSDDIKSLYHVREVDLRKLLQIRTQVDVGISHDWPQNVEYSGNYEQLFRFKPYFEEDSRNGRLGSVAAEYMLKRLRPPYWFSGHMHCKFEATVQHRDPEPKDQPSIPLNTTTEPAEQAAKNDAEINIDGDGTIPSSTAEIKNPDEIDIDDEEAAAATESSGPANAAANATNPEEIDTTTNNPVPQAVTQPQAPIETSVASQVPDSLRAQLPAAFNRPVLPKSDPNWTHYANFPSLKPLAAPPGISNKTTRFLALDKLLPGRSFLSLLEIPSASADPLVRPLKLCYDPEWLAITRALASELQLPSRATPKPTVPRDHGHQGYGQSIEHEERWVREHIVDKDLLAVPENFERVAPVYDEDRGISVPGMPREYPNPQTQRYCDLIGIQNRLAISEEEIEERMRNAPPLDEGRGFGGWGRGRGRGRGGRSGRGGRGGGGGGRGMSGGYRVDKR